jgi:hypothetical protein
MSDSDSNSDSYSDLNNGYSCKLNPHFYKLSDNFKILYLEHTCGNNGETNGSFLCFFDTLSNNISVNLYDTLETIQLKTDYFYGTPLCISKFKKLTNLEISGSRMWDLNMRSIPNSVKVLKFITYANLPSKCIEGMHKLINLETLYLDIDSFSLKLIKPCYSFSRWNYDKQKIIPIPNLQNLTTIIFLINKDFYYENGKNDFSDKAECEQLIENNKDYISTHSLFENIVHRINNICFSSKCDYDCNSYLIIKLTL